MFQHNISFAGAGKVASSLCKKIYDEGIKIDLIVSISEKNGRSLAESCEAAWSQVPEFPLSTDIIIVAVPDHLLQGVLQNIRCGPETLVVHTAGSMGLEAFPGRLTRTGVFYPLQTFSKDRKIEFKGLPVLLEASDIQSSAVLMELVESIGGNSYAINASERSMIHLAAVFICNFTNHMLTMGKQVSDRVKFPFEFFYPLLRETISKATEIGPEKSQTGPAVRQDMNTIEKHMELLSFSPDMKEIYNEITMSIINYYNKS